MTFSTKVKTEIINSFNPDGNELSLLCGIILSTGTISIASKQMSANLSSENLDLLQLSSRLISKLFPHATIEFSASSGKRTTLLLDEKSAEEILFDCGILQRDDYGRISISLVGGNFLLQEREARLAYLAGMFLGAGTVSAPGSDDEKKGGGYHLEWSFSSRNQADVVCEILSGEDIFAKMVERGDNHIVYIKDGEKIATAIGLMGAKNCYLELESQQVSRQMRNLVNRQSNCISANIDKTVSAGLKQVEAINLIDSTVGLNSLPASLQEVASLRLDNPEASLADIQELLGGSITRSAVNLRFRKIMQIAKNLGEDK